MYIKSLHLINFQKHADLQIDFCKGVNILHGSSDAGKSCIRRAMEWIVQNESIDGIRKIGTKQTSVTIVLDNGIEIEKVRSTSINRYILREDGKESVFNAVGKTIPDEIKEKLTIYPIEVGGESIYLNSQPQIALPFLFDKSPSFRMKLFNKLTGNDVLDKLFGQFNTDILRIKRGLREEVERFEERAIDLKKKQIEKEKAEAVYGRLKKRILNVQFLYKKYSKLVEIKTLQEETASSLEETKLKLKNLKVPEVQLVQGLKVKIEHFDQLKSVKNSYEKVSLSLKKVNAQLSDLKPVSLDIEKLGGKIERLDALNTYSGKYQEKRDTQLKIEQKVHHVCLDLADKIQEYKDLLKEAKILCPNCKHDITEDCLRR
jgi:DNA repair ATPase RecN